MGVLLGELAEASADGVVADVVAVCEEVLTVSDAVVCEAALPNGKVRREAARETAFDELHDAFECEVLRGDYQMDVVGHDDEVMELVLPFAAVVLEGFEEELGVGGLLEESSSVPGLGGDEEGSVACCSGGDSHDWTKHTSGAEAP